MLMLEQPYLGIALCSLAIGLVAGGVMHRADFCVTAAFRDLFLFRDAFMLRQMLLLVVATMLLFEAGRQLGLIRLYPFPLLGPPSLGNLLGGMLFGAGMVLAGGCVCGSLYKLGAGSVAGLLALAGMLAGAAGYAEIHPWWRALTQRTMLLPDRSVLTLPQWLGVAPPVLLLPLALAGGLWLWREHRAGRMRRPAFAAGHVAPWRAALVLALLGFISYVALGMPLGITTAYAKIGAGIESLWAPDHVAGLAYFSSMPLQYTPPWSARHIAGGPGPQWDAISALQFPLLLGTALGGLLSAASLGEWHWRWRLPWRQALSALAGGLVMGLASRMVPSCNVWHVWGGLPILALQSMLFVAGLLPGAWLGGRLLLRFVVR